MTKSITNRRLAEISAQSYTNATINVGECEAFIVYEQGYQIIACRGTEASKFLTGSGWVDVLRDIRLMPWYSKTTGWCHAGFLKGARTLAKQLKGYLDPDRPIILTGHSLGGALSLITGLYFEEWGYEVNKWVGFGSPKTFIGNRAMPFYCINHRHKSDIVPTIPWSLPIPYQHTYQTKQLGDSRLIANLVDHPIEQYLEALDLTDNTEES